MSQSGAGGGSNGGGGGGGGSGLPQVLSDFANAPQGFILGAILETFLSGLNTGLAEVLGVINLVFNGTGPGLTGTYGLADIPLAIGTVLVDAGSTVGGSAIEGTGILGFVDQLVEAGFGFAEIFGPLAPIVLSAEIVLIVWLFAVVTRRTILVIADAVPGLAGVFGT